MFTETQKIKLRKVFEEFLEATDYVCTCASDPDRYCKFCAKVERAAFKAKEIGIALDTWN